MGELFKFGDFVVTVPKGQNKGSKGNLKSSFMPPKMKRKMTTKEDRNMFQFGDFCITMEGDLDDAIVAQARAQKYSSVLKATTAELPRGPERMIERKIRHYKQHNVLGHPTRVKCTAITPSENHYVSCSHEDTVLVMCDIYTGREMLSFFGHEVHHASAL